MWSSSVESKKYIHRKYDNVLINSVNLIDTHRLPKFRNMENSNIQICCRSCFPLLSSKVRYYCMYGTVDENFHFISTKPHLPLFYFNCTSTVPYLNLRGFYFTSLFWYRYSGPGMYTYIRSYVRIPFFKLIFSHENSFFIQNNSK